MGLQDPNIDRLIATMYLQKTDRVPNWEFLIESRTVKHLLGYDAGNTLSAAKGIYTADGNAIEAPMNPHDYIKL
jgi:hypothetical protein